MVCLVLDTQKYFDTRKESQEKVSKAECFKCFLECVKTMAKRGLLYLVLDTQKYFDTQKES